MSVLRQTLAVCVLGCLLAAGMAAAAAADGDGKPPLALVRAEPSGIRQSEVPSPSGLRPAPAGLTSLGQDRSKKTRSRALDQPGHFQAVEVASDPGMTSGDSGAQERDPPVRAGRGKVRDLLSDDHGLRCSSACNVGELEDPVLSASVELEDIASIVPEGNFIYVRADRRRRKAALAFEAFEKSTGTAAHVPVAIWFGSRAPAAGTDKPDGIAGARDLYAVAKPHGNGRTRGALDLVRARCPTAGRVFMREVAGALKVSFQPDEDFTGVAYFRKASAGVTGAEHLLLAGPHAASPARAVLEGIVRARVLASPS